MREGECGEFVLVKVPKGLKTRNFGLSKVVPEMGKNDSNIWDDLIQFAIVSSDYLTHSQRKEKRFQLSLLLYLTMPLNSTMNGSSSKSSSVCK